MLVGARRRIREITMETDEDKWDINWRRLPFSLLDKFLLIALFGILWMTFDQIRVLKLDIAAGLKEAAQERAQIRGEGEKQRLALLAQINNLNSSLSVQPAQVLDEVKSIKAYLVENHKAILECGN